MATACLSLGRNLPSTCAAETLGLGWWQSGNWWLKTETAAKQLGAATSPVNSLHRLQPQWPPWAPAASQTCYLQVPDRLGLLNLKLHCPHPQVLPPYCLWAPGNIWHLTQNVYYLSLPQESTNVWQLISLFSAVSQCLEQCLTHSSKTQHMLAE